MAQSIGTVSQIIGPVVDVQFSGENNPLPRIFDALEITNSNGSKLILEVQSHIGEETVRTISMDSTDGLSRGIEVKAKGSPIQMPIGEDVYGRLFNVIGDAMNSSHYGLTFGIVFILVGLAFKISAVPFHMWAPDVYEGSPTAVTLFFAIVPKVAALTVFIRFLYVPFVNMIDQWQPILIFLSIASMIFGAIAAIGQNNLKRLIAYSSIGHMGYALAGLSTGSNEGIQSSIVYMSIYLVMNLAFFSCLLMLKRNDVYYETVDDLSGLSKNHPILSLSLLAILFSLAGIPPLAGFFAKFYIFKAVIEQSMYFLAIVGLLSTVIAAFYYLKIIKVIYFDKEKEGYDTDHNIWLKGSLTFSTLLILLYFIFPSKLVEIVSRINII